MPDDIIEKLNNILGPEGVLTGEDVSSREAGFFLKHGMEARAIARPRTTVETAAVMKACYEAGQSVIAHGGKTGLAEAHLSSSSDLVLSLERMNRIEELDQKIGRAHV